MLPASYSHNYVLESILFEILIECISRAQYNTIHTSISLDSIIAPDRNQELTQSIARRGL